MTMEYVTFKVVRTSCCKKIHKIIDIEWPKYCPHCGTDIQDTVRKDVMFTDRKAMLKFQLGPKTKEKS